MGRKRTYDRDEVLQRAMNLFWQKGFEGAHLNEIVEITGLNRFSLYKEFQGKEGLFQEALELYLRQSDDYYAQTLGRDPKGLGNIRDYFEAIEFSSNYHGCFMVNTLSEKNIITDKAFAATREFTMKTQRLYLSNLKSAQLAGDLAPAKNIEALAGALTALDQGLAVYGISNPDTEQGRAMVKVTLDGLFG